MNLYLESLSSVFLAIKKKKLLSFLILILQIALLVSSLFVFISYQLLIFEDLQEINAPLQEIAATGDGLDTLEDDYLRQSVQLSLAYKSLIKNVIWLFALLTLIFFTLNPALWIMSHFLFESKMSFKKVRKQAVQLYAKYAISSLVLLLPLVLLVYLLFTKAFLLGIDTFSQYAKVLGYFALFIFYILLVCYTMMPIAKIKGYLKSVAYVAFKKIHLMLLGLVFVVALFAASIYFFYFSSLGQSSFVLVMVSGLVFVLVYSLSRLFLIATAHKIKLR